MGKSPRGIFWIVVRSGPKTKKLFGLWSAVDLKPNIFLFLSFDEGVGVAERAAVHVGVFIGVPPYVWVDLFGCRRTCW